MSVALLTCPFCGGVGMNRLPNKELVSRLVTPYHCARCERTFESGPFQLPQKTSKPDPNPNGDVD
jgi:hypothetical protein